MTGGYDKYKEMFFCYKLLCTSFNTFVIFPIKIIYLVKLQKNLNE